MGLITAIAFTLTLSEKCLFSWVIKPKQSKCNSNVQINVYNWTAQFESF